MAEPPTLARRRTSRFIKRPKFLLQKGGVVIRLNRQEETVRWLWRRLIVLPLYACLLVSCRYCQVK